MTERFLSLPSAKEIGRSAMLDCDIVVIGGGIAGLSVALSLPAEWRVVLVTKHALGESNTRYAQGGLAAPVGRDDSPELHLRDTIAAGAGLVSEPAARVLVSEAREAVSWLIEVGTRFDTAADSALDLTTRYDLAREAAHSRRRVLHAQGDATGAEIERALVQAIRERTGTTILEETTALGLTAEQGICGGVVLWRGKASGYPIRVSSRHGVVLANGGAGQLWKRTSNPLGATADGLALALSAGAALADLEFVQFHPTVLVPPQEADEPFLISEAVRGEGAYLRNAAGERFMPRYHPDAELALRDVVARAIQSELMSGGATTAHSAYLDLRHLPESEVRERFPTIGAVCRRYGFDLAHDLIPVAPAAHYFMGGVLVDTFARTTLPRLYAVGEVACTGVHGANRLASNSLLEGLVFGRRAARTMVEDTTFWPETPALPGDAVSLLDMVWPTSHPDAPLDMLTRSSLRMVMWDQVGLRRDGEGLRAAEKRLRQLAASGVMDPETANMLVAAQAITACALARTESRGGHYRADFPEADPQRAGRHTLAKALSFAEWGTEGLDSYAHV